MTPGLRRILVTVAIVIAAIGVVTVVAIQRGKSLGGTPPGPTLPAGAGTQNAAPAQAATSTSPAVEKPSDRTSDAVADPASAAAATASWKAFAPRGGFAEQGTPAPLGSLDPTTARLQLEFAPRAAGLSRILFSGYWETAQSKWQAERYEKEREAPQSARITSATLPSDDLRYVLQTSQPLGTVDVPLLAVHSLEVDGTLIPLFGDVWSVVENDSSGYDARTFECEIRDGAGATMLVVRREISLAADGFDIDVKQRVANRSGRPLNVRLIQYGPTDLRLDRSRYMDIRRFQFGYLLPPDRDPSQAIVLTNNQMFDRGDVIKKVDKADFTVWPNTDAKDGRFTLCWFGTTNRYFCFIAHAPDATAGTPTTVASTIGEVRAVAGTSADRHLFTELHSPAVRLAADGVASFDLAFYAGPLDREILGTHEPYASQGMSNIIVYLMTGCCTWCTFPWLAKLLLWFLSFLHDYVVFDWGLAIIVLVLIVRAILHPLMKRSQIQMQRTTRGMAELKPELEKIQTRFKGDAQKIQQETFRLYKEKGVNPAGCIGGFLPTFLQMPIWIALYAMLYFAIELRQESAFFGFFQLFGGWPFLADLSTADHFFGEFAESHQLLLWNVTGINLIPILMGVVFFVQQKYMTPPSSVKLSPEQESQQKMMKVMTVVLFPLMMYSAPSGLTLYIMTSSLIGIVESRHIRKQVDRMALEPPVKKTKRQDRWGKMYAAALERAQQRRTAKKSPPKKFKER